MYNTQREHRTGNISSTFNTIFNFLWVESGDDTENDII